MSNGPRKRLIIGIGSGRCGTHSLAELLALQPGTSSFHQPKPCLPWYTDFGWYGETRRFIDGQDAQTVGLVAWYYLNYLDLFIRDYDTRVIVLRRERAATVASISRLTTEFDNWSSRPPSASITASYRTLFPQFDVEDKTEALGRYYDLYYRTSDAHAQRRPQLVHTWSTDDLNSAERVQELLTFAGYGSDATIRTEIRAGLMDDYRWRDVDDDGTT